MGYRVLLDALRAIFTGSMGLNLCLFIDALDEHHGAHGNLLDMLHELLQVSQSKPNRLKLCVASRPEAIFVERLRSCAGLRMQDHTESDILTYTRNRLSAEVSQHRLRKKDAFFKNIVQHIANSAQGVFIWVRLVMDELIEAIQQGDDYQSLIELIQEVPEELDDLYIHAIKRMASKRNSSGSRRLRSRSAPVVPMGSLNSWTLYGKAYRHFTFWLALLARKPLTTHDVCFAGNFLALTPYRTYMQWI
ncbi:hypothetical protein LTR40_010056 [Exophiala xenobiotica]|nr:hypothetical protein LTR40_010056 [Exophiala xenobiotica]